MLGQESIFDEIIVDSFAGGGGASTGIELATGKPVTIAINHDPDAILMHKTNHPFTEHFQASVWDVDPIKVCAGRHVGLLWASPDCKHFSKAKGGKPVEKRIRGLAWIVLRWAGMVRPRVILLENVEEFVTWGPVRKGKPVKKLAGKTFQKFINQLRALKYEVEWRELVAADYGAPTTRKRFFLIARCDGRPIIWPEPTHAPMDSEDVKAGRKKPWKCAAEIIDWSLPCPSIFDTRGEIKQKYGVSAQRPLRPNTLRRIARGTDKFVIKAPEPFLVIVNHGGEFRGQKIDKPLQTVTAKHGYGVAEPVFAPLTMHNNTNAAGTAINDPVNTITTGGHQMLIMPSLIQYHSEQTERVRGQDVGEPLMTVDASPRYGLAAATLTKYYGGVIGASLRKPLPTVTSIDHNAVQFAHMVKLKGQNIGGMATAPVQTVTAGGGHHGIVAVKVKKAAPGVDLQNWSKVRALLNEYCDYHLADDEVLLFLIGGEWWFIADIGLRMLTPRELYRAQGFPEDYIIDHDYTGTEYKKDKQVARCGNAVPPPFATALVRANLPEWCGERIESMAELKQKVAV